MKIRIFIATYLNGEYINRINRLYCVIYSLLSQTYQNFDILIHHDGPLEDKNIKEKIQLIDNRISFIETQERKNLWGFDVRHKLARDSKNIDYILFTNDDNYYAPIFLDVCVKTMEEYKTDMVFCNFITKSNGYMPVISQTKVYHIDLGCYMSSYKLVKDTPWEDTTWIADGLYAEKLAEKTNPIKINSLLFTHN